MMTKRKSAPKKKVKVRLLVGRAYREGTKFMNQKKGDVIEVGSNEATALLRKGWAEQV